MTKENIKDKIGAFLSQYFKNHNLTDDEDIFARGFINSLFAMQLVTFIEKEFEIKIGPEDLDFDNFKTINAICALIERKKG
jgi:methoxymalonate biosynthesis acyl carrier protein